jgi:hypothetical protein
VLKHKSGRLEDSGIRIDQDNGVRHYILGLHGSSPLIKEFSPQRAVNGNVSHRVSHRSTMDRMP